MCTSISGVPKQQRHKAYVPGRPAFTNPDALRLKVICKKPLKNPSHWHLQQSTTPGPQYLFTSTLTTISVPKEMSLGYSWRERKTLWGRWASSSHILLAALWRRARLFTGNRRDGDFSGYFSSIMKIDCFRSKTYRQEVALYLPTSGWEAENRAWGYLFWVERL